MTSHDSSENIHCLLYTALIQLEYLEAILCRDRDLSLSLGVIPPNKGSPGVTYYGAYFYPYTPPGVDPVFAVVGGREAIIARPHPSRGIEIIHYFHDDLFFPTEALCSACWTRCTRTGAPLLAVGGAAGIIKIINIRTGKVQQTLVGHGDEIMEILVSPINQDILASASADSTVRLWNISAEYERQPCALICAGEGHRETILSIAFHASGRYLLSGGMDHIVNLWILPSAMPAGRDDPVVLHYPHFATSMVHSNYIDCLAWHGDVVLSKAAKESRIVLWSIQGFNSRVDPSVWGAPPTTHEFRETRSVFGAGFERLVMFECRDTEPFFMRFGFWGGRGMHPVLAMGSTLGRVRSPVRHIAFSVGGEYMVMVGEQSMITVWLGARCNNLVKPPPIAQPAASYEGGIVEVPLDNLRDLEVFVAATGSAFTVSPEYVAGNEPGSISDYVSVDTYIYWSSGYISFAWVNLFFGSLQRRSGMTGISDIAYG
ncbi:WD40 repeat-like protein [Morchella conica CCBAS932]|uniref:WD40 repeat-like protein n=1 Tax=Morchella conica CCBAS932 TaxID=1392247 RepID=A0A3N4KGH5_9PEZI|nr:WD40 repeat-like protein [Morchella conica CCBAS932]